MRFARWTFAVGGVLGLMILLPFYFLESWIAEQSPPALNHPEHFYAFIGVAAAFQLVYLLIASDPLRYRPLMLVGAVGKMSFVTSTAVLWQLGRTGFAQVASTGLDFILALLFVASYFATRDAARRATT